MNGEYGLRRPVLATPTIFSDQGAAMRLMSALEARHIHPRRYFYPSLTRLPYIQGASCPVAEDAAERVLCLPFWPDMDEEPVRDIAALFLETLRP